MIWFDVKNNPTVFANRPPESLYHLLYARSDLRDGLSLTRHESFSLLACMYVPILLGTVAFLHS